MIGGDSVGGAGLPGTGFGADGFGSGGSLLGGTAGEVGAVGAGDGAVAAEGGMFPPYMGAPGAVGRDQDGRSRQTWMNEDPDIWNDADRGVPPVIG